MAMYQGSGPREEYRRAAEMYSEEKVGYFEQVLGQPLELKSRAEGSRTRIQGFSIEQEKVG
jgi:hypothetical protein